MQQDTNTIENREHTSNKKDTCITRNMLMNSKSASS